MKKIIKLINSDFIKVILFICYFLIIGLGALIYKLFTKKTKKNDSYWQDYPKKEHNIDYFKSSY